MDSEQFFNHVSDEAAEIFNDGIFNVSKLPRLFKLAMETAEKVPEWDGNKKSEMVVETTRKIVDIFADKKIITESVHKEWDLAIQLLGPTMLTLAVNATKGLLKVNVKNCCVIC